MKRKIDFLIVALFAVVLFASCERVAPNYAGVLMENYGKQGKEDFKIVAGKETDKWRNRKTLSFCGKNARIASRVR